MEKMLSQLLNFAAIVEQGSMTGAAALLGASKSSVSKKLKQLENAIDLQLFHREHKKLSLTDAGHHIYQQCQHLTDHHAAVISQVESIKAIPSGTLRINITTALGEYFSHSLLPAFQKQYPRIHLHLKVSDSLPAHADDNFDITIRVMSKHYNDLVAHKITHIESLICATPRYLAQQQALTHPDTLAQHNCLLWESEELGILRQWQLQHQQTQHTLQVSVDGDFQSNHLPSLRAAALNHRGIAYLPKYLIQSDIKAGRLTPLFSDFSNTSTALYGLFPPQKQKPRKLEVFLDFMQAYFSQSGSCL